MCWQLLAILRGESSNFIVHGGHPTLFKVELPWTPQSIMEKLVTFAKELLVAQIILMMERQQKNFKRHLRKCSNQSQNILDNDGHRSSFDSLYSEGKSD